MDPNIEAMAGSDGVSIHAGFPNPAADRRPQAGQLALNLNQLLVRHPSSTYLFRITGHQWVDQGIYDGDIAIIDRAPMPRRGDLVIVWQTSGFSLCRREQCLPDEQPWGVVTSTIHQFGKA